MLSGDGITTPDLTIKGMPGIIASFAKLVPILKEKPGDLAQWNTHARSLLEETSEAYVKAKANAKLQVASHKEAFEFFGVPEDRIDAALRAFYGQ